MVNIERYILGGILLDNKALDKCLLVLETKDFTNHVNKQIYEAMIINHHKNIGNDYATLYKILDKQVDIEYLVELSNSVPSVANIGEYINNLKENSNKNILENKLKELSNTNLDSQDIIKELKNTIDNIKVTDNTEVNNTKDFTENYINALLDGKLIKTTIPTQFEHLNQKLGISAGDLIIIASRPGCGKSALALNFIEHFSKIKKKVLLISLEMTKEEILNRLLSLTSGVNASKIKNATYFTNDEKIRIMKAKNDLIKMEINIYDRGGLKVEHLQNICTKLHQQNKLDILLVDYIGLLRTNEYKGQKVNEVGFISSTLKQIAMNLKIPVIALSQLNRAGAEEPTLTSLRDSGSLEQDANAVLLIHDKSNGEGYENRYLTLKIAKNRAGEIGKIPMVFTPSIMTFRENFKEAMDLDLG